MTSDKEASPFQIDVGKLRSRPKDDTTKAMTGVDRVGEEHGFVPRTLGGRRGRLPSPRTGQIHAKVMPEVSEAIAAEARRRGTQQGVIIEEAWALYEKHGDR